MKKRQFIILGSIISIFVISYYSMNFLGSMKPISKKKIIKINKRYVQTEKVKYQNIKSKIFASGRLSSKEEIDIISQVPADKILKGDISFKKGETFKKGTLLLKINNQEKILVLKSQKSKFLNSLANILPDLKVDYSESFKSWENFFDEINILKKMPKMPEIRSKQEKIFLSSRNILSDYYAIEREEIILERYNIYAPFDGTFTDVFFKVGSVANMGSRLAKIIRTNKLELEVPLDIINANFVKIGDFVKIENEKGTKFWKGKIIRKSNFVDEQTQAISIFIALNSNAKNKLYKGMYLKAVFENIDIKNTMEIPRNAVFNTNEVFIVKNGVLEKKEIKIEKINEKTLLFSGISENTNLVVQALINVSEGTEVQIN